MRYDALATHLAQKDDIFTVGTSSRHPQGLYADMSAAVYELSYGLNEAYVGNQTGIIVEQPLDPGVVLIIRDIFQAIMGLRDKAEEVLEVNGEDPIQQFNDAGILVDLEYYLYQIDHLSSKLYTYQYP